MSNKKIFKIKNHNIKVDIKKNLLNFLNPTSKGTNYWDSPPERFVNKFEIARIILQVHQFFDIAKNFNINLKNKSLLDVGTGNGMVPNLILNFSNLKSGEGTDPFYDGEHITSWQKHDRDKLFKIIKSKFIKNYKLNLKIEKYKKDLVQEDYAFFPQDIKLSKYNNKKLSYYKYGAHSLNKLKKKYDIIYCKAIEHINDSDLLAKNFESVSKRGTIVYFKHRSFFSYLGPHRYASTGIPWGHLILNENEIKKYVKIFHKNRSKQFLDFFYKGLSYPRFTVGDLIKSFVKKNFTVLGIKSEAPRHHEKTIKKVKEMPFLWSLAKKNHPNVSEDEILSGIYHIILKKL